MSSQSVLSAVWNRELTGRPIPLHRFRTIRAVDIKKLSNVVIAEGPDGKPKLKMERHSRYDNRVFHRMSHDATCIVAVCHYPYSGQGEKVTGRFILYDLTPLYLIERIRFPIYHFPLRGTSFVTFNLDSSILCTINVLVRSLDTTEQTFLTADPINIQFGIRKGRPLCLSLSIQDWFEVYAMDKKRVAKSVLRSYNDIFVLNYGRTDISVFGFYDEMPADLLHAKIFAVQRDREEDQVIDDFYDKKITYSVGGLEVRDVSLTDGRQKIKYSLVEMIPKARRPTNPVLYFAHTHIDLERIFRYTTEQFVNRINAKLVTIHECKSHLLDIEEGGILHVYLRGSVQISRTDPTLPSFLLVALLIIWNLSTNQIKCQLIDMYASKSPYQYDLDACLKRPTGQKQFFDFMTCHDSVFNADSVKSILPYFGGISLHVRGIL